MFDAKDGMLVSRPEGKSREGGGWRKAVELSRGRFGAASISSIGMSAGNVDVA